MVHSSNPAMPGYFRALKAITAIRAKMIWSRLSMGEVLGSMSIIAARKYTVPSVKVNLAKSNSPVTSKTAAWVIRKVKRIGSFRHFLRPKIIQIARMIKAIGTGPML